MSERFTRTTYSSGVFLACLVCGKEAKFACSACYDDESLEDPAVYCSEMCREKDWPRHAEECPYVQSVLHSNTNNVDDDDPKSDPVRETMYSVAGTSNAGSLYYDKTRSSDPLMLSMVSEQDEGNVDQNGGVDSEASARDDSLAQATDGSRSSSAPPMSLPKRILNALSPTSRRYVDTSDSMTSAAHGPPVELRDLSNTSGAATPSSTSTSTSNAVAHYPAGIRSVVSSSTRFSKISAQSSISRPTSIALEPARAQRQSLYRQHLQSRFNAQHKSALGPRDTTATGPSVPWTYTEASEAPEDASEAGDTSTSNYSASIRGMCRRCGKPGKFVCAPCGPDVQYCSKECQTADWKYHYAFCKSQGGPGEPRTTVPRIIEQRDRAASNPISSQTNTTQQQRGSRAPPRRGEDAEDLRFYLAQLYRIIQPVLACILLSILWVKLNQSRQLQQNIINFYSGGAISSPDDDSAGIGLLNAAIILGQIIVVTIILVFLFRKGYFKVIYAGLGIITAFLLGVIGFVLVDSTLRELNLALDWISLAIFGWNYVVLGMIAVFWRAPLRLQQAYLVLMSSLMAFSLSTLAEWTTWGLLGVLVIWDLFAVLAPFGPLRLLLEASQEQNQEVPALLYSVGTIIGFMAYEEPVSGSNKTGDRESNPTSAANHDAYYPPISGHASETTARTSSGTPPIRQNLGRAGGAKNRDTTLFVATSTHRDSTLSAATTTHRDSNPNRPPQQPQRHTQPSAALDDDDEERQGLKLGLGDFVFYSVLIARASLTDWLTTVACAVAVVTGLSATIFILAILRKALPALPISIVLGMLFYFTTSLTLFPYLRTVNLEAVLI